MIYEQAFMALPEFLTGAPFKQYEYEGTVVNAFSMAILQELNARNVLNPISSLRGEVSYPHATDWRSDLHLNLNELQIFTDELRKYGYYEENWMEVKFCRMNDQGKPIVAPLKSTFLLLHDLIRLCGLVPDNIAGEKSKSSRYLLHAYQGNPDQYFVKQRNEHGRRVEREWIEKLLRPGKHELKITDLGKENTSTFSSSVGTHAGTIKLILSITNLAHIPTEYSKGTYYLVLTRIDDFIVMIGSRKYGRRDQMIFESHNGLSLSFPRMVAQTLTK